MEPSFKSLVDVNNPFLPIYMNMTGKFHENSGIRSKKEWRDVFWMLFNNRGRVVQAMLYTYDRPESA